MRRVVFLGPPGAGKGTQARTLAAEWGVPLVSTGDLLRAAVRANTPLGQEASGYMNAGKLVPDDLVLRMLRERVAAQDARTGFILDGFPRNVAQAEALGSITPLDVVVAFELPAPVLIERLSQRRVCPTCQTVYNLVSSPPRAAGKCDRDGATLEQRPDDRPAAVATRLRVYAEATAPLLEFYRARSLLRAIDATGDPGAVADRVRRAAG